MILKTLVGLLLIGAVQLPVEAFKKEMAPLQSEADKLVSDTGAKVLSSSKAMLIEGYGVVVSLEVALEPPRNALFPGGSVSAAEVRTNVASRQKAIKEKITALLKQRVVSMESVGPEEFLTVVIHILNANPVEVPNLPRQIQFSVKKSNPLQVSAREF